MSATLGAMEERRRPLGGPWLVGVLFAAAFVLLLGAGTVIGLLVSGSPSHPSTALGGPGAKIVQFKWVENGGQEVCLAGNPKHPPCYQAFMPQGTKPVVGDRYYARFFTRRTPDGVSSPAVAIISVAASKYS